jgi:hypothetical protein
VWQFENLKMKTSNSQSVKTNTLNFQSFKFSN